MNNGGTLCEVSSIAVMSVTNFHGLYIKQDTSTGIPFYSEIKLDPRGTD